MDSLTLTVVGAAYAGSLAAGLSWRARRRESGADALLAAIILCAIVAMLTIVGQHTPGLGGLLIFETLEYAATLAVGPLLLLYMGAALGRAGARVDLLHFLPAAATLALAPFADRPLLGAPIELLVLHQIVYTGVSFQRFRASPPARDHHRFWAPAVLGLFAVVHLAQLVRIASSASPRLEDIVPATLAIGTLGLGAGILWVDPLGLRTPSRVRSGVAAGIFGPSARSELAARAKGVLELDHLYRDPSLSLRDLASSVDATPHELSAAINEVGGESLTSLLRRLRLEDARRRLDDPSQDHFSIEGIGQMSGFGSRSSFYEAFRAELGTTPARYRACRI